MAGERFVYFLFAALLSAWRKAKYEWLKPSDYASFSKYEQKIKEIFNGIGLKYKINFKELKYQNNFV